MASQAANEDISAVRALHGELLEAWNRSDARAFASLFEKKCVCVGFDGSVYTSSTEIESSLKAIFKDHKVASYVRIVRDVWPIAAGTILLRAVAGMVPPGSREIKPERNAVQLLVASNNSGTWKIASYQNTPARYDGRPEMGEALTEELTRELQKTRKANA
jgi:uncharacterized protein (TIGR02246 family)